MSGCFPTEINHTDVEDINYKNHELLLENIDILKKEIKDIKDSNFETYKEISISIGKILRRVDALEGLTISLREQQNNLCAPSLWKQPFQCPVCKGNGTYPRREYPKIIMDAPCHGCEGKGIVWG